MFATRTCNNRNSPKEATALVSGVSQTFQRRATDVALNMEELVTA